MSVSGRSPAQGRASVSKRSSATNRLSAPGPDGGFTPLAVPGLQLWLRSDKGIATDGSNNVSQWNDLGPLQNNFSNATPSSRPAYTTPSTGSLAPYPIVSFNAANSTFLQAATNITVGPSSTIFVVAAMQNGAASGGFQNIFITQQLAIIGQMSSANNTWGTYDGVTVNVASWGAVGSAHIFQLSVRNAKDLDGVTDGNVVTLTQGSNFPGRTGTRLGADPSGVQFCSCDVVEVLVYNGALPPNLAYYIRQYIYNRYKIGGA